MKKLAVMLAAVFAVGAVSAASLEWGFSEDSLLYVNTGSDLVMANNYSGDTTGWKFCLVYLGSSDTLNIANVKDSNVIDSFDFGVYEDGGDAFVDPYYGTFVTTGSATAVDGSSITLSSGDRFGVVFFDGTSYSNVYLTDGSSVGSAMTDTVAMTDYSATAFPVSYTFGNGGNVAVSVPEPGIACMALLGLGMLIKRRRA